eukprot:2462779-Amphidinium_carterae.1
MPVTLAPDEPYLPSAYYYLVGAEPCTFLGLLRHSWKEGEVLVFDDSFEHEVVNNTDAARAVLLLRFFQWDT